MNINTQWLMDWGDRMNEKWGSPDVGYDWCRNLAYAAGEEGNDHPSFNAIALAIKWEHSRFKNVYCSQCGKDFGPGEHGFSHCNSHKELELIPIT